ncbi:MAG: ATP-binding protein [Planctomycetota bacterium]
MSESRLQQLAAWLQADEGERLEFKEAKGSYHFDKLVEYCAALANEGGGKFVLGVTDKMPRRVVGTQAFTQIGRTKRGLVDRLRLRIDAEEIPHPGGRVLVFHVPPRPLGMAIPVDGAYLMRSGDTLAPMTPDMLKRIFEEAGPDFSAEVCTGASEADLTPEAMEDFRARWLAKSGNEKLKQCSAGQLLRDAELVVDGGVTYAALILFGTSPALSKHLPPAEIVLEYRSSEASGPAQRRWEFREGFFCYYAALWARINERNDLQHFRDGLFVWDIPTFNEAVLRESILNAVSHRDYRLAGSVFISQYPRKVRIVSPGGLPPGITPGNILSRQCPRNRRIAETFAKCGLVERAGQGMNLIVEECIRESKAPPNFAGTDDYQVSLAFNCTVSDPRFLRFLEQIGGEQLATFTTEDFLVVDMVYRGARVPEELKHTVVQLVDRGILERVGRGRGVRYILSRRFHDFLGEKGTYTRRRGLDRATNRELLLKHIRENRKTGSRLVELQQVLPDASRGTIKTLLAELKADGAITCVGRTKGGRWYPVKQEGQNRNHVQ